MGSLRQRIRRPGEPEDEFAEQRPWKQGIEPSESVLSRRNLHEEDIRREYVNRILADDRWVWRVCLLARILNALLVRTYFNPDEHWQSLEVAHRVIFGYGHLTWEWERGIRSYVHPLIFAALYKVLAITGLDTPWFMARTPRLLQAVFAAACDVYLFKLTTQVFGRRPGFWALFSQMINWFTFFCMTRTLSNSLETTLTIVALYYWPEGKNCKLQLDGRWISSRQLALMIAALSCALRPTNAVIWLYVGVVHLFQTPGKFRFLLAEVFPIGVVCLTLAAFVDRWMYGYWTLVPLNFLKFNFLSSGGDFYGTHPWHWYFSQGFPVMVFSFIPLTVFGILKSRRWYYAGLISWVLGLYSFLGHKEFRFVLPVLPLTMMFAGYALESLEDQRTISKEDTFEAKKSRDCSPRSERDDVSTEEKSVGSSRSRAVGLSKKQTARTSLQASAKFWWILMFLFLTNMPAALYTSVIHQLETMGYLYSKYPRLYEQWGNITCIGQATVRAQLQNLLHRGGEAVIEYLANEACRKQVDSVLFLMPCHSTPFYSSLHKNISMRFLDCSPSDQANYIDEADHFKMQPMVFLNTMFPDGKDTLQLPSHIVLYDSMGEKILPFLREHSYRLERRFFHAHFPVDRELQAHVLLYTLPSDMRSSSVV